MVTCRGREGSQTSRKEVRVRVEETGELGINRKFCIDTTVEEILMKGIQDLTQLLVKKNPKVNLTRVKKVSMVSDII